MNKPATKEPSMDEILSSIRQIIADDDASVAPAAPSPRTAPPAPVPPPVPRAVVPGAAQPSEPLALSAAQIVSSARPAPLPASAPEPEPELPAQSRDFASMLSEIEEPEEQPVAAFDAELVDPEDITFEPEPEPQWEPEPPPPPIVVRAPEPVRAPPPSSPRPAASVAHAAPMPDPTLSDDIAEQLIDPVTDAAVQGAMSRLGSLQEAGIGGMTLDAVIRQMLKPMLKDWLDENLPAMVERLVEREISRISRGVK